MRSPTTATSSLLALAVASLSACATARPLTPVAPASSGPAVEGPSTLAGPPATTRVPAAKLRAGIVTLRVTGQEWNWKTPWAKQNPWTRTVTGLVVPGRKILVASTAFGNHLLVEVQKRGRDARTPARASLVEPEGPLAIIEVDEAGFWEDLEPLPLAERLPTEGEVTIHRWQRTGLLDSYSGTVRQIRSGRHGLSQTSLLTLDIGSGVDSLGDSEVVIVNGAVVGLVTGRSGDVFAALGSPVLARFLQDAASGDPRGFARAGLAWQDLTNPALRAWLGLGPEEGGIRITRVLPHGSAGGVLRPGDVVLEVGGVALDPTGHYEHPIYGRMLFALLFSEGRYPGDAVEVKILRDGHRLGLSLPLKRMQPEQDKIPPYVLGRGPDYAIEGGLVFQELTVPYLSIWGDWRRRAPPRLLVAYDREGSEPTPEAPRLVLLSSVLPDPANLGYQGLSDLLVDRVNGRPIGGMGDLRAAFARPDGRFHIIELRPGQARERIVLDAAEAAAAAARIHEAYGVERIDSEAPAAP